MILIMILMEMEFVVMLIIVTMIQRMMLIRMVYVEMKMSFHIALQTSMIVLMYAVVIH